MGGKVGYIINCGKMKPTLIDPKEESLSDFRKHFPVERELDNYRELLGELFLVRNPHFRFGGDHTHELAAFFEEHFAGGPEAKAGAWAYFPWSKMLIHYLKEAEHLELRTARNKNLITADEQAKFYGCRVGIAGLSVGSHAALTLAMMGGAQALKLADPDTISGSNLNRIRADFTDVGTKKIDFVSRQIYQMNPYAEISEYGEGVSAANIPEFMDGLDVLVEELDQFEMKIRLRLEAKKRGIPVVMATDNGDNIIFDIERYDLIPGLQIFNGSLGNFTLEDLAKTLPTEFPKIATKIAGTSLVVPRMLGSVLEVGRTLYSWPQLGDAATLAGVAVAYVVRKLALKEPLRNGKLEVNLNSVFDADYSTPEGVAARESGRKKILDLLGL